MQQGMPLHKVNKSETTGVDYTRDHNPDYMNVIYPERNWGG